MSTAAPPAPTAQPQPRGRSSRRKKKRAKRAVLRVLKWADVPLGTVAAFVPPALALQEFKEVLEADLES